MFDQQIHEYRLVNNSYKKNDRIAYESVCFELSLKQKLFLLCPICNENLLY